MLATDAPAAEAERLRDRAMVDCARAGGAPVALETHVDGAPHVVAMGAGAAGSVLALATSSLVFAIDLRAPTIAALPGLSDVEAVAVSPDGARVAAASRRLLRLWDVRSGLALASHALESTSAAPLLAFVPDALDVRFGGVSERLDARTLSPRAPPSSPPPVPIDTGATVDPSRSSVSLQPARGASSRSLSVAPAHVVGLAPRPDARALAVATDDGRVLLWSPSGLWPSGPERASVVIGIAADRAAAFVAVPTGQVELLGDAADALRCRFGRLLTPFAICAERFVTADLAVRALAGASVDDEP